MGRGRCSHSVLAWGLSSPGHCHHGRPAPSLLLRPPWKAAGHCRHRGAGLGVPMCQRRLCQNPIPTVRSIATAVPKPLDIIPRAGLLFFTRWESGTGRGAGAYSRSRRKPPHRLNVTCLSCCPASGPASSSPRSSLAPSGLAPQ